MSIAVPVRLTFDDYVLYTEHHPEDAFELINGVIYQLAPEGDSHLRTRSAINTLLLSGVIDLQRYSVYTEASFPVPGYPDGPRPDNFVAQGSGIVAGKIAPRPTADTVLLVIEISSSSRRKDRAKANDYARVNIPEYWRIDLENATAVSHTAPDGGAYTQITTLHRGEIIVSDAIAQFSIATDFLLQLAAGYLDEGTVS